MGLSNLNIRLEFEDIFREYVDNLKLAYQDQGIMIVCYIYPNRYFVGSRVSISVLEELFLHFISFIMVETDSELVSLRVLFGKTWVNLYNEVMNRWGDYHPYYTGRNLNDLFDIQDLDKSRSFDSIELKFRKI